VVDFPDLNPTWYSPIMWSVYFLSLLYRFEIFHVTEPSACVLIFFCLNAL